MRFQVAKRDLEAALQVVSSSISNSGSDISAHYTFRRTGKEEGKYGIEVLTYANQTCSSCPLAAVSFSEVGDKKKTAFTIEGWRLKDWLKCIPADSVPEFSLVDGEVTIKVRRGSQDFQSLDPSTFPYWDKVLAESEVKATLPADRLAAALAYSRLFIMDKDGEPDKSVCEVLEGVMYSSDRKAVTLIKVPGMEESSLRVHGKDVSGFLTFLGTAGDGNVEILEHERNLFVRRCVDGAVFGEARFQFQFPVPKVKLDDPSHHIWEIPCDEFRSAIGFLVAGADPKDNRLCLAPGAAPGEVTLSMTNTTGKVTTLTLSGITMQSDPQAPAVPEAGFMLDHNVLDKVLTTWKEPMVQFGISFSGGRGLLRCRHEKLESVYLTIIATLR